MAPAHRREDPRAEVGYATARRQGTIRLGTRVRSARFGQAQRLWGNYMDGLTSGVIGKVAFVGAKDRASGGVAVQVAEEPEAEGR